MKLSPTGVLVDKFWCEIPDHFPHVKLGVYVVMPNHVHGILFLDPTGSASAENREEHTADDVETGRVSMPPWRYPDSTPDSMFRMMKLRQYTVLYIFWNICMKFHALRRNINYYAL